MSERKSYRETTRLAARNRASGRWPSRSGDNRLEPVPRLDVRPTFTIQPGDKVFTIGSCFARNVEENLAEYDFRVPVMQYVGAPGEVDGHRPQEILNKYSVASIAQEFDWVLGVRNAGGVVRWEHVEPLAVEIGEDEWLDLHLASSVRVSKARLVQRRQQIYDVHVQAFDAALVIITPGVTECWFDSKTSLYIQQIPPIGAAKGDADRFWLEVLDYASCRELLNKAVSTLLAAGVRNILMTVSPVPLQRTMTGKDVLVANTYSKSVIRAVVGDVCGAHAGVDYFPSYEIVTLCRDPKIWNDDLIHLQGSYIAGIVKQMLSAYAVGVVSNASRITAFNEAFANGDAEGCAAIYAEMGDAAVQSPMARFHKNAARFFTLKDPHRVIAHAKRFQELCPKKPFGFIVEGQELEKLGRSEEAMAVLERGVAQVKRNEVLLARRNRLGVPHTRKLRLIA